MRFLCLKNPSAPTPIPAVLGLQTVGIERNCNQPALQPTALTEYDEPLVRRLIEKVTVYEDKFTVEFKSGVTVDVGE